MNDFNYISSDQLQYLFIHTSIYPNFINDADRGDIVWVHSIVSGTHYLIGKMKLDVLLDREETEKVIKRDLSTVHYDEYWINQWKWEPLRLVDMGDKFPRKLNFLPLNRLKENYKTTQTLRVPRILSPLDHNRLMEFWNSSTHN